MRAGPAGYGEQVRRSVYLVAGAALLTSCAAPVTVPAAPHAADPRCADIVLALPDVLDGMTRLDTTSQATTAWGERGAAVVLRCGVEPPPPTTDPCTVVDDGRVSVDWVTTTTTGPDGETWTFTTYGREPAVEVQVPPAVTAVRSGSFLVDLGSAVSRVEPTRTCL